VKGGARTAPALQDLASNKGKQLPSGVGGEAAQKQKTRAHRKGTGSSSEGGSEKGRIGWEPVIKREKKINQTRGESGARQVHQHQDHGGSRVIPHEKGGHRCGFQRGESVNANKTKQRKSGKDMCKGLMIKPQRRPQENRGLRCCEEKERTKTESGKNFRDKKRTCRGLRCNQQLDPRKHKANRATKHHEGKKHSAKFGNSFSQDANRMGDGN